MTNITYSQEAAIREAVEWLQMEALVFASEGKEGNRNAALSTAALIQRLQKLTDWAGFRPEWRGAQFNQLLVENDRLRGLFKKVQDHCAGDAHPRWDRGLATSNSRGYLLDICNAALD